MPTAERMTYGRVFRLWVPLAATWVMVAIEGPFLAAVIARLPEPTINLAAYGVAFAVAVIVESPIIMILSAATALIRDQESFRRLRRFTYSLNLLITLVMLLVLYRPVFGWLSGSVLDLPQEVAALTHRALLVMIPWPGAIGYRRFYQGLLISQELTRRVAYGTVVRVVAMAVTAIVLYSGFDVPGAIVGCAALTSGVVFEALATRFMAGRLSESLPDDSGEPLSYRAILDFYIPLLLTSILALAVHPMVTFFLGRSRMALASLAVYPVVMALTFIFRSVSLSYQEVAIALLDGTRRNLRVITRFALALGLGSSVGLAVIAFTPLAGVWFRGVSGLSDELAVLAVLPLQIFCINPLLSVLLAFQRSILVYARTTRPVTVATAAEVLAIVGLLSLGIHGLELAGVVAAAVALLGGRLVGNAALLWPVLRVLRSHHVFKES